MNEESNQSHSIDSRQAVTSVSLVRDLQRRQARVKSIERSVVNLPGRCCDNIDFIGKT
jgi:hypothetical protein